MNKNLILNTAALALAVIGLGLAQGCCGCFGKKTVASNRCESGACGIADHGHEHPHPESLSTEEMKAAVVAGDAVILDARTGKYFNGELIPSAKQLAANSEDDVIVKAVPNKNAKIITYCSNTECPASNMLAEKLLHLGYTNVQEYPEGIAGWKAAGGKVIKVN